MIDRLDAVELAQDQQREDIVASDANAGGRQAIRSEHRGHQRPHQILSEYNGAKVHPLGAHCRGGPRRVHLRQSRCIRRELEMLLTQDEGRVPYAYPDSLGYLTIDVGHPDRPAQGRGADHIIDALLDYDIEDPRRAKPCNRCRGRRSWTTAAQRSCRWRFRARRRRGC